MRRGEVWLINLDPTVGSEIKKTRPAVIVNDDAIGILPLRVIVPITAWQERYAVAPWMVRLDPSGCVSSAFGFTKPLCATTGKHFCASSARCHPSTSYCFFPSRETCVSITYCYHRSLSQGVGTHPKSCTLGATSSMRSRRERCIRV